MGKFNDLTGKRFNRLLVLERAENHIQPSGAYYKMWRCICDCGKECITAETSLKRGHTKSCGCLRKRQPISLVGQTFGRLVVLERAKDYILPCGQHQKMWKCKCTCGNECVARGAMLKNGSTKSCGCFGKEKRLIASTKHGKSHTRLHNIWRNMIDRCYNPKNPDYRLYGAEGKTICLEWLDKENGFINFYNWSMEQGYQEHLEIDRINGTKGYSPENCRWTNRKEQNNNKRNNRIIEYKGKRQTAKQWSKELGINYGTLLARLNRDLTIEKALTP